MRISPTGTSNSRSSLSSAAVATIFYQPRPAIFTTGARPAEPHSCGSREL
ncbi:MAG: hypothetical protein ACK4WH_10020 [Phycisphaerales bacterium]